MEISFDCERFHSSSCILGQRQILKIRMSHQITLYLYELMKFLGS